MATRLQSYLSGPSPSFTGSEWNNRTAWAQMPKTVDQRVLASTYDRSQAAHNALMQAQLAEAQDDNDILATATPEEFANLFGQPRTEREARLQKIVQRDSAARERGAALIPNDAQKIAYSQKLANLRHSQLTNYLDPLKFNLAQQNFSQEQARDVQNWYNQQQQRIFQNKQLSATEKYREMQKLNAEANRTQRGQFQQQNFQQREQFHNDSMQNFKSEADRKYYENAADAVARGALSPQQVTQMFQKRFDPGTMAMLRGLAQRYSEANPTLTANSDPGFFSKLGQYFGFGSPTPPPSAGNPASYDTGGFDDGADFSDDYGMGGGDFSTPPAMRPTGPRPTGFKPGSVKVNIRTGQQARVDENGQLVPLPSISASDASDPEGYGRRSAAMPMPARVPRQAAVRPSLSEYLGPPASMAPVPAKPRDGIYFDSEGFMNDWRPVIDATRTGVNYLASPYLNQFNTMLRGIKSIPAVQDWVL